MIIKQHPMWKIFVLLTLTISLALSGCSTHKPKKKDGPAQTYSP